MNRGGVKFPFLASISTLDHRAALAHPSVNGWQGNTENCRKLRTVERLSCKHKIFFQKLLNGCLAGWRVPRTDGCLREVPSIFAARSGRDALQRGERGGDVG